MLWQVAPPPHQVGAALSQLYLTIGHLRQGLSTAAFPKNTPKSIPEAADKTQNAKLVKRRVNRKGTPKNKTPSNLDIDTCVALLSKEENLSRLLPVLQASHSFVEDTWLNSYVSANTFFENKTGFPESGLEVTRRPIELLGLDNKPLLTVHVPVFQQQRRYIHNVQGFGKNKRSPQMGQSEDSAKTLGESVLGQMGNSKGNVNITIEKKTRDPWVYLKYGLFFFVLFYVILPIVRDSRNSNDGGPPSPYNIFESPENFEAEKVNVKFSDVRGVDEAKQELQDAVAFLKNPEKFQAIGAKLPKGILLVGQPGIGKTLLAKAVAGEAGVPFFYAAGAQFDDMYVGSGARKIRKFFAKAKMNAPCVLFIDEIDSAGAKRTNSSIHPYANQTINQLLAEMDGFNSSAGIIVIGATNKRANLDEALVRPGRFDVEVSVRPPDTKGREEIFKLYLERVKCDESVNVAKLAAASVGMTGAHISNVVNQGALRAALLGKEVVSWEDLDYALDKTTMGAAWKNKTLRKAELEKTAYHEAGHALVLIYNKEAPELNKVTILPRGKSLGLTSHLPDSDSYSFTKAQYLANIDVAMGGRVAEELIYGGDKVTSGATSDFQKATANATSMVKRLGMSEKVGVRVHGDDTSAEYRKIIDSEIERILKESYDRVKVTLQLHNKELDRLAKALLQYGTLNKEEVLKVIKGQEIDKEVDSVLKERNITST